MVEELFQVIQVEAGGGRSRSWNWSVIGGKGGDANKTFSQYLSKDELPVLPHTYGTYDSGSCGDNGESCGEINIHNGLIIFAYGGAGRWFCEKWKCEFWCWCRRLSSSWYWPEVELVVVGGDHACNGGRLYVWIG